MNSEERWLSVKEIATHLGISKETVYRWLERNEGASKIPAHKVGRLWKFKMNEVDAWVRNGGSREMDIKELNI